MSTELFETPILFLIFNRPDTTQQVFDEIRKIKPARLYVAADGPRADREGEAEKCQETRDIICKVDWQCDVKKRFLDVNLGCKLAVSSAIDWFFENVEEGIVLEDDCCPHMSFFPFCSELLERYRTDNRIMQICGTNVVGGWDLGGFSYYFSAYGPIWGWASWRRAWANYDAEMTLWPEVKKYNALGFCISQEEVPVRRKLYDRVFNCEINTWDYQWGFAKLINSGLSIIPSVNLVTNIGFRDDATHATNGGALANIPLQEMSFPIRHPHWILRDRDADMLFFDKNMREKTRLETVIDKFTRLFRGQ